MKSLCAIFCPWIKSFHCVRGVVDFLLSKNRDKAAAVRFFKKAIGSHEAPEKITPDGSQASHQAVAELKTEGVLPAQSAFSLKIAPEPFSS